MGLLGNGYDDPRSAANMALAAGLLQGNMGAGLLGANQAYGDARNEAIKRQYMQAQMDNLQSEVAQRNAVLEAARRKQSALPGLFQPPSITGGQAVPQTEGGMPMFSKPMGTAPMQTNPGGLNVQAALAAGYSPEEIQKLDALRNIGLNKVARTVKGLGPDGKEYEYQVDDFGRPVGQGMAQYRAPHYQDLGGQVGVFDAYGNRTGSLGKSQTPDSIASNAVTMRGQNMVDARSREANTAGRVPAGYRQKSDGTLEFIPGGPADPNAAKKAAPTEFQGKAGMFGNRAQEADKIITSLDGKYSPSAVNAKMAADNAPWYLGGGVTGAVGNLVTSKEAQMAEQAQRDFINAVLRLESGAAIAESEFTNARKQYFPQPFDSASVKAQKAANRKRAIDGLLSNARASSHPATASETAPTVDDLLKKYGGK